jgi:regulator of sigma E protease
MVGEHSGEKLTPEEMPYSFTAKPVGWRLAIVAAGPLSNLVFAVLLYYFLIVGWGLPSLTTRVGDVVKDQPAALAGVLKSDLVVAIDGNPVEHWGQMVAAIQDSGGRAVRLTLERGGRKVEAVVQPLATKTKDVFGDEHLVYRVGIIAAGETVTKLVGAFEAVGLALDRSFLAGELIVRSVVKLFQGKVPLDNVGGPIQIGQAAGQAARHGVVEFLSLMAILSVNLAVLNLLPIPALDGGHVFFYVWEAVTRRPVPTALRKKAQQVSVILLVLLMTVIIYNDIARLVTGASQ